MKKSYLTLILCLFLISAFSQNKNLKIVEDYIENFNKKDSIATINMLHKNFMEYWQSTSVINKNKKEYAHYYSWANIMQENEEIEIVSTKGNTVVVNSTYYSDLDKLLGKLPYKCKKTFVISKGKIIKIINDKNKRYDYYQNKRKSAFINFKNWLNKTHGLKRQDFKLNHKYAKKMKKIILDYISENEIAEM